MYQEKPAMSVRIGVNPIGWSNDDLAELGGATPLETCLREARAAGYEGIELGHKFPREATALRATLGKHDLALVSGWYSTNLLERDVKAELEAIQDHAVLLRALDCDVIILAETSISIHGDRSAPLSGAPGIDIPGMRQLADRLTELSLHLVDLGLRTAYHHHVGTVVETPDQIDALMDTSGASLGLLLDTGHCAFGGGDPVQMARTYAERVTHVHCKDIRQATAIRAREQDLSFLDAVIDGVFTVPGDGSIDFHAVLSIMVEQGYQGWVVVEAEQDPKKADPATYAKQGHETLSAILASLGS
jgi:inosose dehydratase